MDRSSSRMIVGIVCTAFFGLGMLVASLGPALPTIAQHTHQELGTVGRLMSALFMGSLGAQFVAGPLNDRRNQLPILMAGLLLLAVGVLGVIGWTFFPLVLVSAVIAGFGHGTLVVTGHVLLAHIPGARSTVLLNALNVCFGVGAVLGPAIASLTIKQWQIALPPLWIGIGILVVLMPLLLRLPPSFAPKTTQVRPRTIYAVPVLWMLGLLLFVYVGVESSMAGWAATYVERSTATSADEAALITSGFWLTLTLGRVIGAILGQRLSSVALLGISVAGVLLGGAVLLGGVGNATASIAALLLLGLACGPIFPSLVALTTARFAGASGAAVSVVVAIGNGGGVLGPSLVGWLMDHRAPSATALFFLVSGVLMVGLLGLSRIGLGRQQAIPEIIDG